LDSDWLRLEAALGRRQLGAKAVVEELAASESPLVGGDEGGSTQDGQDRDKDCGSNEVLGDHRRFLSAQAREKPGDRPG